MTYLYEQLSPEKFQELCQSILVSQFPNVQCLPVAQPDGGRDAFTWSINLKTGAKQNLIVFQVKFVRNAEHADKHFLESITQGELPKVKALKERGIEAYYLLTNAMGSAHLDVGSVDKMDTLLSGALGIPAFCWWRNDLDRRVDQTPDIKWSFPEIIRGSDLLQSLVEGKIGEEGRRRDDAVRSYIAAQHRDDREVKFKQVDLFNNLLDLFVDTFLREIGRDEPLQLGWRKPFDSVRRIIHDDETLTAELFLSRDAISQRIVLEGAPGQGKSTISQYICQVHRIRLLDHVDLARIPPEHLRGTLRIPLRIDLRDYASWLSGKNPFASELGALRPAETQGSLEAFLSFQITHTSGGHSFSVSDLSALSRVSHLLLVLDGFDEVADVTAREQIVKEISKATVRLEAVCRSLQVIVTSRPAAFAKSPGFPRKEWEHYSLISMSIEQINNYADRWLKARKLPGIEQAKFKQVLREKLNQPHMRDLARNPMQLAILLNLIQTKGLSLPDKRTALYDSYMDLFFSREAEKSTIVRDHRDLLIDLHRYLAWIIQTEAEEANSQGSIPEEKLRHLLKDYLAKEGHETALVDELFTGMIERVVALVSRVQGTFEFEVQPLREYFAARHLYETAPYSPPGGETPGTKPERFEALAVNFYWLNVTRFYCGCYSRGELSSLADGLLDLGTTGDLSLVSYPRLLVTMLLGDWVFGQQPHLVRRLCSFILQQSGFTVLLASLNHERTGVSLITPERCGRDQLLSSLLALLKVGVRPDVRAIIARSLREAHSPGELLDLWAGMKPSPNDAHEWLLLGRYFDVYSELSMPNLIALFQEYGQEVAWELMHSSRFDAIDNNNDIFKIALAVALRGSYRGWHPEPPGYLYGLAETVSPSKFAILFNEGGRDALKKTMEAPFGAAVYSLMYGPAPTEFNSSALLPQEIDRVEVAKCDRFLMASNQAMGMPVKAWLQTLAPWKLFVEAGQAEWKNASVFFDIALMSGGINSKNEQGRLGTSLLDDTEPLCDRIRYARLKSGAPQWWAEQFKAADDPADLIFVTTIFMVWATPRTIIRLSKAAAQVLDEMQEREWSRLLERIKRGGVVAYSRKEQTIDMGKTRSERLQVALCIKIGDRFAQDFVAKNLADYDGADEKVLEFCADSLVNKASYEPRYWNSALLLIKRAYKNGIVIDRRFRSSRYEKKHDLPEKLAKEICQSATEYPLALVQLAQAKLTDLVGKQAKAPGLVSRRDNWFN